MNRSLRRSAAEITDSDEIEEVLREARVLFISLHDEPAPYVVPVCFGREPGMPGTRSLDPRALPGVPGTRSLDPRALPGVLYVHSGLNGAKMELLRAKPQIGFSACTDMTVVPGASACAFTCRSRSVCGTGTARIVEDEAERVRGLESIMRQYAGGAEPPVDFTDQSLSRTCVICIHIDTLRGKRIG
jgi:nitroimidazol reductase NimA-like FMN-containing flavoprotein (pyridoxamine 5'-phosphate oxidase superfamily)